MVDIHESNNLNTNLPFQNETSRSLSDNLNENLTRIKNDLGPSIDLIIRHETVSRGQHYSYVIVHLDGISNQEAVNEDILNKVNEINKRFKKNISLELIERSVSVSNANIQSSYSNLLSAILFGDTVLLLNDESRYLVLSTKKYNARELAECATQTVVRGQKESFNESLRTNTSLIRMRIQNAALRIKSFKIGNITRTNVEIVYIEGLVKKELLNDVISRLEAIDIDDIIDSSYIEKQLQNEYYSIFPTIISTERPDIAVGNLLEGRIVLICDGTSFVLILPITFFQLFTSPSDYYEHAVYVAFLRNIRYISGFLSLYVTPLFVAVATHHQGVIPTTLLISLVSTRERVPFPFVVEALILTIVFEVLREACIRMPRAIGPAISIVGGLILGQSAVLAGFVSPSLVIVIAAAAILSFTNPNYNFGITLRLLNAVLLIIAAYLGLYGILILSLMLLIHLCGLRSFGVPYMSPLAPFNMKDQKDTFIITPSISSPFSDESQN